MVRNQMSNAVQCPFDTGSRFKHIVWLCDACWIGSDGSNLADYFRQRGIDDTLSSNRIRNSADPSHFIGHRNLRTINLNIDIVSLCSVLK